MFSHFGEPMNGWTLMLRIAVAVFVGAIIGAEREMKNRPAGMRTHVLVCLGAAIVALIEQMAIAQAVQLQAVGLINVSIGRITASVVSGVGFLGAGTIVLSERHICGLTTAASLWCTACIGLAAGAGYLGAAVISGLVVLVVLRLMQRVVRITTYKRLEVQFIHRTETLAFLNEVFAQMEVTLLDVNFHAESRPEGNQYTNVYTLSMPNRTRYVEIIGVLSENRNILKVGTRDV